jgi:hypothetical protein
MPDPRACVPWRTTETTGRYSLFSAAQRLGRPQPWSAQPLGRKIAKVRTTQLRTRECAHNPRKHLDLRAMGTAIGRIVRIGLNFLRYLVPPRHRFKCR